MPTKTTVDTQSSAVKAMAKDWPQTDALKGGTEPMRDAKTLYLPKEKREKQDAYSTRVQRSFLLPAYGDTVRKLGAAPFRTPVTVSGEDQLPPMIRQMLKETDRQGRDFTAFWKMAFTEAIHRGLTHVFPDFPAQGLGVMRDEELATGVHPYLVHVSPFDMPGWKMEELPNGQERLKQFRFRETGTAEDPDNPWGDVPQETYFVYNLVYQDEVDAAKAMMGAGASEQAAAERGFRLRGSVEIWRRPKDGEDFEIVDVRPYSYIGNPLVTLYITQTGHMTGEPTFKEMGYLNVQHWQSDSDQNNLLHTARVPILFRKGISQTEYDEALVLGATEVVSAKNPDASLEWTETEGRSLGAGKEHGQEIENRMEMLGMQPRVQRPTKTATGEVRDAVKMESEAESWVRAGEMASEMSIRNAAQMINEADSVPEDMSVDWFNDFSLSVNASRDITALKETWIAGGMPTEDYLAELKRRNVITDSTDIQALMERLQRQGPGLDSMGFGGTAE